jgi:hypothetical protein
MIEKSYNVWKVDANRWVNCIWSVENSRLLFNAQDVYAPLKLSYEGALLLLNKILHHNRYHGFHGNVYDIREVKNRRPRKVIPDIPLDPSLPILMAGHLQDRMRKLS